MSQYLQYIARIFVPTSGENGKNGTCYPIAPNRVITAAHVLEEEREDKQGDSCWHKTAEILWNQHEDTEDLDWWQAKVLWNGHDEGFDIAVLETNLPAPIRGYPEISLTPPPVGATFPLRGFAAVGTRAEGRHAVSFDGEVLAHLPVDKEIPIGVRFAPDEEVGWKGASGSPIIVKDRLQAVLVNCPVGFNARQTSAISIQRLMRSDGFREAIGLTENAERLTQLREHRKAEVAQRVTTILCQRTSLAVGFVQVLAKKGIDTSHLEMVTAEAQARGVAELLVTCQSRRLLATLLDVARSKSLDKTDRCNVREIAEAVLPIAWGRPDGLFRQDDLLSLRAVSRTTAALFLAMLEGCDVAFSSPDTSTGDLPHSRRSLLVREMVPAEGGMGGDSKQMVAGTIKHCLAKLVIDGQRLVSQQAAEFDNLEEAVIPILRRRLRSMRDQGGSVNFPFTKGENAKFGERLLPLARELKSQIPELVSVFLAGDGKDLDEEHEQFEKLIDLLKELEKPESTPETRR
jgi:hypothetical protein